MSSTDKAVTTVDSLIAATKTQSIKAIILGAETGQTRVSFAAGSDGLKLSTDNRVLDVYLSASPANRAIYNDVGVANLEDIELRNVTTRGRVQLLARDKVRGGHVEVNGLDIIAADDNPESCPSWRGTRIASLITTFRAIRRASLTPPAVSHVQHMASGNTHNCAGQHPCHTRTNSYRPHILSNERWSAAPRAPCVGPRP
jgi:hypothetical protein